MNVRRLEPSNVALFASIDRSEHVEVQYRIEDGRLVEAPVFMADIPTWDPDGRRAQRRQPHRLLLEVARRRCTGAVGGKP